MMLNFLILYQISFAEKIFPIKSFGFRTNDGYLFIGLILVIIKINQKTKVLNLAAWDAWISTTATRKRPAKKQPTRPDHKYVIKKHAVKAC